MRSLISKTFVIVTLGLLVVGVSGWTNPVLKSDTKTIFRRLTLIRYPVELSFKLNGQPLKSNETVLPDQGIRTNEFDADSNWLRDFTVSLKNTSGKTITYTQVNLSFPEVIKNGRVALHQIHLGVDPDRKFSRPELRLEPNESLEIPLAARYDDLRTLTAASGLTLESLSQITVEFHAAFFEDETLFQAGTTYRRNRDPNDTRKWILIGEK